MADEQVISNVEELNKLTDKDIYDIREGAKPKPENYEAWLPTRGQEPKTKDHATTTQATTTAATTTTEPAASVTVAPDFNTQLKEKSKGKYETWDAYEKRMTDLETFETEYNTNIKPKYEKFSQSSKILESVDEELLKVNSYMKATKSDVSTAMKVVKADLKTLDKIDTLALAEQIQNPEGDIALYKDIMKEKYDIEKPSDYDELEDDAKSEVDKRIRHNKYELDKAASMAAKTIQSERDKIEVPKFETFDKEKTDRLVAGWQPKLPELSKSFNGFKFELDVNKDLDGNKEKLVFDIPLPEKSEELKKQVMGNVAQIVLSAGLELNEKNLNWAKDFLEESFYSKKNMPYILQKVADDTAKKVTANIIQHLANNGIKDLKITPPGKNKTEYDEYKKLHPDYK